MNDSKESGGWFGTDKDVEHVRQEEYKALEPERWQGLVKNVIHNMLFLTRPQDWLASWAEIKKNIFKQNEMVRFPIPVEDIEMMYTTMASEMQEEMDAKGGKAEEASIRKEYIGNKTNGTYLLASYLTKKYDIITVGEKEREMYVYRGGMYARAENEIIYPEIQRILGNVVNKNAKNETFHKIADMTSYPRSVFSSAPLSLVPLANGVYDMVKKELLPHSASYRFTYQFPVRFDPLADCPKTKSFLGEILDEGQKDLIQEWMGYYFYRSYMFKKAVIFVGEGDTGKTTLLETIINLLGVDNVSSVSLHKMASDKFAAAHLYGKHGNLVDELSANDISDTGNFKIATGGGSISGEYKYGNQFSFQNFSKMTFACNKIPDVKDFDDEAYFGRWMVIHFKKTIEKKVPNFIERLTTEEERSGLFNFVMLGLERLLSDKSFSYALSPMEIKTEMMRSGSSIAMFCSEEVHEDIDNEITKEDMYEAYSEFCQENGLAKESIKMLGTKFLFYVKYASEGLITVSNQKGKTDRVRGWKNVGIKKKLELSKKLDNEFDII